jgi:hypothetical protein
MQEAAVRAALQMQFEENFFKLHGAGSLNT